MEKEIDTDVELNEFRTKAGLETKPVFTEEEKDPLIKQLQHQAGI
jgi:hypothetical protein